MAVGFKRAIKHIPMKYYYLQKGIPEDEKRETIQCFEEWKSLKNPDSPCDEAMHLYLAAEYKIGVIPGNAFYYNSDSKIEDYKGQTFLRFSVCKNDDDIDALEKALC